MTMVPIKQTIAVEFPPLSVPVAKIVDPGKVRLGDACIAATFPPR